MTMRVIFLLVLVFAPRFCASAFDDKPPVITVCEALTDLQRYEAKVVVVVGRYSHTDEGAWLDAKCGFTVKNGGREFPDASISVSYVTSDFDPPPRKPSGFSWDRTLLLKTLRQITNTTNVPVLKENNYTDQWMAVFGRLETHLPRKMHLVDRFGKESDAYTPGFGHLSGSPAQLISPGDGYFELKVP